MGLVCGDPSEQIDAVTVAVDATPAVLADVPERGLLLAHHPLLLRGVDTIATSTPKGALVHEMIRTGRCLFTAHTNADAAAPGVSDALAAAIGLKVDRVLSPMCGGPELDKWVVYVPHDDADGVREAMFDAGAGHIGDYSHCSWSVTGIGHFLAHDGASPTIGSVGTVERVSEDRVEAVAPASARAAVLAAMRAAHSLRSRPSMCWRWRRCRSTSGWGVSVNCRHPSRCAFVARVSQRLPATSWGVRAAGDPDAVVSRVAVCGGLG